MHPVRQFGLATVALLASTLVPVETPGGGTVAAAPERANISIDALLPSWRARVEWGLDRFAAAGLELPPMEVIVHPHKRPCDGNSGLYQPGPPVEVHLCLADAASRAARMITLHELAHAWAETQLEPAQRERFLEVRGLRAWVDPDRPTSEWGGEHAAEVLSWGLMDTMVPIIRIEDAEPAELRAAFEQLVGRAPLWADA